MQQTVEQALAMHLGRKLLQGHGKEKGEDLVFGIVRGMGWSFD